MSPLGDTQGYSERDWQVYALPFDEVEQPEIAEDQALLWCNSDSEMAKRLDSGANRLYVDLELLSVDQDPRAGGCAGRLSAAWRDHPAGTLAICSYEKVGEQKLIYLLEVPTV
jgi:hypothetical protein